MPTLYKHLYIYTDTHIALRWRRDINQTAELVTTSAQETSNTHSVPCSQLQSHGWNTRRYVNIYIMLYNYYNIVAQEIYMGLIRNHNNLSTLLFNIIKYALIIFQYIYIYIYSTLFTG